MSKPSPTLQILEEMYEELLGYVANLAVQIERKFGGQTPPELFDDLEALKRALRVMRAALDAQDEVVAREIARQLQEGKRGFKEG